MKSGQEIFTSRDLNLDFNLLDFWSWSQSNILDNTLRGVLAEFIVAKALRIKIAQRVEWDAYDLKTKEGLKIEVKSSSYLQSWEQTKHSNISFSIARSKAWDMQIDKRSSDYKRQADVYVFCLLHHKDKSTVNPLNMDQWTFFVLDTKGINEKCGNQKTISLNSLLKLKPKVCTFEEIKCAIS